MSATHEFNEGDLVEAVKGERVVRDRLYLSDNGLVYILGDPKTLGAADIFYLLRNGFTITVLEPATPKVVLPTEAGIYADKDGDLWVGELNAHGRIEWFFEREFKASSVADISAPFTRLEPVPVTAKAVLDRVRAAVQHTDVERLGGVSTREIFRELLQELEAKFGVQS